VTDNPKPPGPPDDKPADNQEIEEFFHRLPANFRWPKPSADAVAAATEAIHRLADEGAGDFTADPANACAGCGGSLPMVARFCIWCGLPKENAGGGVIGQPAGAVVQQHVHHHYHHAVEASGHPSSAPTPESESSAPRGRAPSAAGQAPGGRAENAARQVVQDWAQACNIRHIDDLVELYAADATLIRSSAPPVRSLPAIREFLVSMLEAGLGDVEMESLRLEVMGEIAMDIGRCKMLVPVAMGKRREERGKYLVVLARQPASTWKILADCWSQDLAVIAPPTPHAPKGK
jgi:ketosteroid isomerase-like protein